VNFNKEEIDQNMQQEVIKIGKDDKLRKLKTIDN
jgi:hypothetical protein